MIFRFISTASIIFCTVFLQAQDMYVYSFENAELVDVVRKLETDLDLVFNYTAGLLEDKKITLIISENELDAVLHSIFDGSGLAFELFDSEYVVLTPAVKLNYKICVHIKDSNDNALPYAALYIPSLTDGVYADENGYAEWNGPITESDIIEISFIGYQKKQFRYESLLSCPTVILDIKEFSFSEVVVRDYVTGGIEQAMDLDHMILRPDKISMIPGLTDADVLQMVQLLPGVESIDESATGLSIRGGTSDQNLILYDGITIYNGGHFFGMISGFNPSIIDNVNVYLSGFGPQFGGRLSSVIDIISTRDIPEKLKIDAGINFTHGDMSIGLPLVKDKMALIIGARKSYTDIIETPTYQKLSQRIFRTGKIEEVMEEDDPEIIDFNLGFDFNDYNAKLIFKPTENDYLAFNFFQIDDNLDFLFTDNADEFSTRDKLDLSNTGFGIVWNKNWSNVFKSHFSGSNTLLTNNYRLYTSYAFDEELDLQTTQLNNIEDLTLSLNNNWQLSESLDLDFGFQYSDLEVERAWLFGGEEIETGEDAELEDQIVDKNQISSTHLSIHKKWANGLRSELGMRWSFINATQEQVYEPRALLQFAPTNSFQLKASAGLYRQFMNQLIEFNDLGLNQNFWVLADDEENTSISKSYNYYLGFLIHPRSYQFEIEGYYKSLDGLRSNFTQFNEDLELDFEEGSGTAYGLNILLKKTMKSLQAWISYSLSAINYSFEQDDELVEFKAPQDRPHSLSLAAQYKKNKLSYSLSWKIASGIRHTPARGLAIEDDDAFAIYNISDINTTSLPVFHRLDLSVMYDFQSAEDSPKFQIGFSIMNLYNRANILSREYFPIYNEENNSYSFEVRDREMMRFTPNVVIRYSL